MGKSERGPLTSGFPSAIRGSIPLVTVGRADLTSRSSRFPRGRCCRPMTPQYRPGFCSSTGICSFFARLGVCQEIAMTICLVLCRPALLFARCVSRWICASLTPRWATKSRRHPAISISWQTPALARVGKRALDRPETLHTSPGQVVRKIPASDHTKPITGHPGL